MKPIFTVIMPCYNSEEYLEASIESVINQTSENWNLIAINDGSTDETLNILNKYKNKDKRISIYSKENGGYVSAVNYALDYVKSDYFLFMGSDDQLDLDLISVIEKSIDTHKEAPDYISFGTVILRDGKDVRKCTDKGVEIFSSNTTIKKFEDEYKNYVNGFFG